MAAVEFNVTMKLLIDTQNNRVLFAEASKDCVDFLFHMLSLPIATVISLENGMVGAVENLYHSIQNLHESYIMKNHTRDSLLKPNFKPCACSVPMLKHTDGVACVVPVSDVAGNEGGLVKGVVTYMVMDDLVVQPMSNISFITLLSKFNVGDVSSLQEKTVTMGFKEAVKLLKASLHSKKVLTQVFLAESEPKVKSKTRVKVLEELVSKLQAEIEGSLNETKRSEEESEKEINSMKLEVQRFKSAMEAAELKQFGFMLKEMKSEAGQREAKLELHKCMDIIKEQNVNLMDKENKLQVIREQNEELVSKLDQLQKRENLESDLNNKEIELRKEALAQNKLLVGEMMNELKSSKESEAHARTMATVTLVQLETTNAVVDTLKSSNAALVEELNKCSDLLKELKTSLMDKDTKLRGVCEQNEELASNLDQMQNKENLESTEAYDAVAAELDQAKDRVKVLEGLVSTLQAEIEYARKETKKTEEVNGMEIKSMKLQIQQFQRWKSDVQTKNEQVRKMLEERRSKASEREAEICNQENEGESEQEELVLKLDQQQNTTLEIELQNASEINDFLLV